jgi:hypothetical protein
MNENEQQPTSPDTDTGETAEPDIPIDFSTFVLSLSSSAAYHLGMAPDGVSESDDHNLPMAKQTIDILSILQEKTKGNLTGEEERLLAEVIYSLRMAFVRESNQPAK